MLGGVFVLQKNEEVGLRLTMLQALHGVIKVSGKKMSEKHQTEIMATLISLQNTAQEGHRLEDEGGREGGYSKAGEKVVVACVHISCS